MPHPTSKDRSAPGRALVRRQAGTAMVSAELVDAAKAYAAAAKAENTRRAYRSDWQAFERWCTAQGLTALPAKPEALALYISALAGGGRKVASIERALAAVSEAHKAAGHGSPRSAAAVRAVVQGVRRKLGIAQTQKAPIPVDSLRRMVEVMPATLKGTRDRALMLVGFASAMRRSELVAIDVAHLEFTCEGVAITIPRSKTNQEGAYERVGIPFGSMQVTCPVKALRAWLDAAPLEHGPVFRSVNRHGRVTDKRLSAIDVARVVKSSCAAIGLDAARFAAHSLRSGLATAAAKVGKPERDIMQQTRHRSATMVRKYIRTASLFASNAADGLL